MEPITRHDDRTVADLTARIDALETTLRAIGATLEEFAELIARQAVVAARLETDTEAVLVQLAATRVTRR